MSVALIKVEAEFLVLPNSSCCYFEMHIFSKGFLCFFVCGEVRGRLRIVGRCAWWEGAGHGSPGLISGLFPSRTAKSKTCSLLTKLMEGNCMKMLFKLNVLFISWSKEKMQ